MVRILTKISQLFQIKMILMKIKHEYVVSWAGSTKFWKSKNCAEILATCYYE